MQTCWRLDMVSPTWTFSQPKITMELTKILEFSLTFCWGICLWTDRNLRWWCFNSNWDILFNPHPNLRGVPWVFLPVLSVMITIVGELIKKMLPTVCWYDMRAILLQHLGGSALWEVIFVWEPCHQEWKICEMAFHIEGLICIIWSSTMFKLYLPAGRFGLGGSKISYLI